MGMFDDVNYTAPCHKCGTELTHWQSKDGPCELLMLEPKDVGTFYTNCPKCNAWNQYRVEQAELKIVPDHRDFLAI